MTAREVQDALRGIEKYPTVLARDYKSVFAAHEEHFRAAGMPEKWEDFTLEQKLLHHKAWKRHQQEMQDFGHEIHEGFSAR